MSLHTDSTMDELQDVIPEDPDDCDDFAPDGTLGFMLEEYRKSKQEKHLKLEERAVRDGRPFSAPVASPSCDDIKKRQQDSRALKETPPGVDESRVVYRPASGPAKLRRSTNEVNPSSPRDMHAHGSGEVEYTLAAVPEEANGAVGAQKSGAGTAATTLECDASKESGLEMDDNGIDRLRLEDVDDLEQEWECVPEREASEHLQLGDSGVVHDEEDMMLTAKSSDASGQEVSELHSSGMETHAYDGQHPAQHLNNNVGTPESTQHPAASSGIADERVPMDESREAPRDRMESAFNSSLPGGVSQVNNGDDDTVAGTPASHCDYHGGYNQQASSIGEDSMQAVDTAIGSIMEMAANSSAPSTSTSLAADYSSAGQLAPHTTDSTHASNPVDMGSVLEVESCMPKGASGMLHAIANNVSPDKDTLNSHVNYHCYPVSFLGAATAGAEQGTDNEDLQAKSSTPSFAIDRALGSIISGAFIDAESEDFSDQMQSRSSSLNQNPAALDTAEGRTDPAMVHNPVHLCEYRVSREALTSDQLQQDNQLWKDTSWGSPDVEQVPLSGAPNTTNPSDTVESATHQSGSNPIATQSQLCLEQHTGPQGQQAEQSDAPKIHGGQHPPVPRQQQFLPRKLSKIMPQGSTEIPQEILQQDACVVPVSAASPLPRPAPQLFPASSFSEAGTMHHLYQSAQTSLGWDSSTGVQEPQLDEEPGSVADGTHGEGNNSTCTVQSLHSDVQPTVSNVAPSISLGRTMERNPNLEASEGDPTECMATTAWNPDAHGQQPQGMLCLEKTRSESEAAILDALAQDSENMTQEASTGGSSQLHNHVTDTEISLDHASPQHEESVHTSVQTFPEHESTCSLLGHPHVESERKEQSSVQQASRVPEIGDSSVFTNVAEAPHGSSVNMINPSMDLPVLSKELEQPDQHMSTSEPPVEQTASLYGGAKAPMTILQQETSLSSDRITHLPAPVLQPADSVQTSTAVGACSNQDQFEASCDTRDICTHCGAQQRHTSTTAHELSSGAVQDRLALFACGRMGAEALLQGDVLAALTKLLEGGTQDGMSMAASVLRRSVTLTIGQRSQVPSQNLDANSIIVQRISQIVGLMMEAAKVSDLIPQLLEANWDTVLTEVPRALGPIYQLARAALQQLLHTEKTLLSAVQAGFDSTTTSPEVVTSGTSKAPKEQHQASPAAVLPSAKPASQHMPADKHERQGKTQREHDASGKKLYMAPAVLAACECGRPVVFGAPDGWEIVPEGGHVHARRTVSGKNRARKGGALSPSIQQHMEEAMQPDGADLEYVYLGPSRGVSASPPATPSRSAMYIAAYSPPPGTTFVQEDTAPYAAVDEWSAAPRPMSMLHPQALGHRASRSSTTDSTRGSRPKTAGARIRPVWDDTPAGIPPRTRSQDGPGLPGDPEGPPCRPGSAEPYSQSRYQHYQLAPSRVNAPHAWVGTYWDNDLSPYVRQSFEQAQAALMVRQAAQSTSNWLRDDTNQSVPRGGGGGGWTGSQTFQAQSGGRFAPRVQGPAPGRQQQHQDGYEARHAFNMQAHDMQEVYAEQLNEMLRYANQCSAMLGSKYRYKAARRRPASAAAGKYIVATALEGCVERHVLAADGASTLQDPGMIKVMSCAKFMSLLEQLAVRVNGVRGAGGGKKKTVSQGAKNRRRGAGFT